MFNNDFLQEQLLILLAALNRIPRRFTTINKPDDFLTSDEGIDKLDAICMILIAVGESIKKIDRHTQGQLLANYPQIDWKGIKGVRDIIAHGYFDVDEEQVFSICQTDIPELIHTIQIMIQDLQNT